MRVRGQAALASLLAAVEAKRGDWLADLEHIVNIDSGTGDVAGVDAVGDLIGERLDGLGATVQRHADSRYGDIIVGVFERPGPGPQVLLVGHLDTVFEPGTARARPMTVRGERVYGPGTCDMKGGLLVGLYALFALRALAGRSDVVVDGANLAWLPVRRLVFIANPDEEIGSISSLPIIREHAASCDAALVLEAARDNGDIVSARKGQLDVFVDVVGRAAHSGVTPESGRSAVVEAAHQVLAIAALDGRFAGSTVNPGVVRGGTRPNVVAEHARIEVDVRAAERPHLEAIEAAIREIAAKPTVSDVTARVTVGAPQWPMRKTEASARLVDLAIAAAATLGLELRDTSTGGSSDANTISDMGVPTIDGLGPVGGGDHTAEEYIELDSIVPRTALLAALLHAIGSEGVEPA